MEACAENNIEYLETDYERNISGPSGIYKVLLVIIPCLRAIWRSFPIINGAVDEKNGIVSQILVFLIFIITEKKNAIPAHVKPQYKPHLKHQSVLHAF
jgi:hypothetical protein